MAIVNAATALEALGIEGWSLYSEPTTEAEFNASFVRITGYDSEDLAIESTNPDDFGGGLIAPMPGAILATEVKSGDTVSKGDVLIVLEAMKMEHRITAPRDGKVENVHVTIGDQVEKEQLLVSLEEEEN